MNKNDYLKRLAKLLYMLKEDEIRDILCEYEQHIDMKIEEGLSEKEAVSAFGTVEELAAEILDAYHVKPDFKEKKSKEVFGRVQSESKKAIKNAGKASKGFWEIIITKIRNVIYVCRTGLKKTISFIKKCLLAPIIFIKRIFGKKHNDDIKYKDQSEKMKREKSLGSYIISFFRGILCILRKFFYGCLFLFFGSMGIAFILLLGFMVVLLILGYPVIGVTIAVLGAVMAVNAVAYFAGHRWRKI